MKTCALFFLYVCHPPLFKLNVMSRTLTVFNETLFPNSRNGSLRSYQVLFGIIDLSTMIILKRQTTTTIKTDIYIYIYIYIYIPAHWPCESIVRQWPERPGFNPRLSHTKDSKMAPWKSSLSVSMTFVTASFIPQLSYNDSPYVFFLELRE